MTWRVGRKQPRNLYFGDDYRGVMFDESDARAIVEAMNAELAAEALSWLDGTHPMIVAGGFHSAVERVHKAETCLASAVGSRANPGGAWASDLLGNPEKGDASEAGKHCMRCGGEGVVREFVDYPIEPGENPRVRIRRMQRGCPECHGSGARPSPAKITTADGVTHTAGETGGYSALLWNSEAWKSEAKPDASEGDSEAAERIFNEYARKWERFANLQEEYRTILTKFYRHVRAESEARVRELQSERITISRRLALLSGTDEAQHSIAELLDMADREVRLEYERAEQALKDLNASEFRYTEAVRQWGEDLRKVEGELAEANGKIGAWEPCVRLLIRDVEDVERTPEEALEASEATDDAVRRIPLHLRPDFRPASGGGE